MINQKIVIRKVIIIRIYTFKHWCPLSTSDLNQKCILATKRATTKHWHKFSIPISAIPALAFSQTTTNNQYLAILTHKQTNATGEAKTKKQCSHTARSIPHSFSFFLLIFDFRSSSLKNQLPNISFYHQPPTNLPYQISPKE